MTVPKKVMSAAEPCEEGRGGTRRERSGTEGKEEMKRDQMFVRKLFGRFFLPALFSSLALAVGGVADSLYIGGSLGEDGLFVIGTAYPVYLVFSTLSIGMASGGAVHLAAALSEGRENKARQIFFSTLFFDFLGILALVGLGLSFRDPLIAVLGATPGSENFASMQTYVTLMLCSSPVLFLQAPLYYFVYADDDPRLASGALIAGNLCDCAFGFLFIVVLQTGVTGSVWSTLCGAVVTEGICLIHFFRKKGALGFHRCGRPDFRTACRSMYTGLATAAVYLYQFAAVLAFNRILLEISGESAVAVYDVVFNAGSVVAAITEGVSLAMIALVSAFYGERNAEGVKGTFRLAAAVSLGLTLLAGGGMALAAGPLCTLFGISEGFLPEAAYAMRLYAAGLTLACLNGVAVSGFQSVEAERKSYLITALRSFVLLLPFGGLFALGGYDLFWWCFVCAEGTALTVAAVLLARHRLFRADGSAVFSETFAGSPEMISALCERMQAFLEENGAEPKRSYFISLSADEALRLIASDQTVILQVTLILRGKEAVLHIRDNARKFNPLSLSEEDEIGLRIIKNKAKDFHYRPQVGFNTLTLTF